MPKYKKPQQGIRSQLKQSSDLKESLRIDAVLKTRTREKPNPPKQERSLLSVSKVRTLYQSKLRTGSSVPSEPSSRRSGSSSLRPNIFAQSKLRTGSSVPSEPSSRRSGSSSLRPNIFAQSKLRIGSPDPNDSKVANSILNESYSNEQGISQTNLKRKLLVYKQEDNFYIEHAAAYALQLINTRAIMLNQPHLVQISLQTLHKLENNPNIEIEYVDKEKQAEISRVEEGVLELELRDLEQGEYGIGVHGIDKGDSTQKQKTASKIMEDGLKINDNSKTVLSTAISLGTNDAQEHLSQDIIDYNLGRGLKMNVVLAVPLQIQNKNGEKIYLGFPERNKRTSGQQYDEHCILDQVCGKMGKVPSEFILGYYLEHEDGSASFVRNLKHYSNISKEEQESLYQAIFSNMNDFSRKINELIDAKDINKLSEIRGKVQQMGINTANLDNAIIFAQKEKEAQAKPQALRKFESEENEKGENPPKVDENKFAKIYKKANTRIGQAFEIIKSIFKGKSKDKDNNNPQQNGH